MKRVLFILACSGTLLSAADLAQVHSVYIISMARGMDQYLANRLTGEHIFRVVTDPKVADAIFTDRIGSAFEDQLAEFFPPPAPPPKPAPATKEESTKEQSTPQLLTDTANKLSSPALHSSFGRGQGTFFLVDPKSKQVLWSTYEMPKGSGSTQMDRTASDIVSRLKRDLKEK